MTGTSVRFTGWESGFLVVSFVKLLLAETSLGLKEAKEAADGLLEGVPFQLDLPTPEAAVQLLAAGVRLRAVGELY